MFKQVGIAAAVAALAGCSAVNTASSVYSNVKAGMGAKSAYTTVKDMKDAQPVFVGYTAVVATAEVAPRKEIAGFPEAFADNMRYLVTESARAVSAPIQACVSVQACGGRVLAIQFTEDGFNRNLVERVTMGDRLRGKLVYMDLAGGRVIAEKRIEGVEDYTAMMGLIRGSLAAAMLKSFPPTPDSGKTAADSLNRIASIKPGYEKLFKSS